MVRGWHVRILLCITVARILWDFDFIQGLATGRLDGFSIGRYENHHESFDLCAAKFESGAMRFWWKKIAAVLEPFQSKDSTLVLLLQRTVNGELKSFKIAQKPAFEAKGRLYTTGEVIQSLFIIDLHAQLAIYGYR